MTLQSTSKSPRLGSRPHIKEPGSILDLSSNQELEFRFLLVSKEKLWKWFTNMPNQVRCKNIPQNIFETCKTLKTREGILTSNWRQSKNRPRFSYAQSWTITNWTSTGIKNRGFNQIKNICDKLLQKLHLTILAKKNVWC